MNKLERQKKIDALVEFLDDNHITIIETSTIQGLIIDAQFTINQDESEDEYNELIEKGLTDEDFESLNEFLELIIDSISIFLTFKSLSDLLNSL